MKTVVDPRERASTLARWNGATAKLWMFHVTHNRLALHLSRFDEPEVLYVVANGCTRIEGRFSWEQCRLEIVELPTPKGRDPICHVLDRAAGFRLVCSSATVARGPATEMDKTFENFLGEVS